VLEAGDPDWTEGLRPELVLVYGGQSQNYIEGFTVQAMEDMEDAIEAMEWGDDRSAMEMNYSTKSLQMNIDDTGRIILNPMLIEKLGLEGEAVFAGTVKTFQIWHPDEYAKHVAKREEAMAQRGDGFDLRQVLNKPAGA
jgi:MraZ protein